MADSLSIETAGKATRFRAYAPAPTMSRRGGQTVAHTVEEVVAEGRLTDGKAAIDSALGATRVVLYAGPVAEEVVVGSADLPKGVSELVAVEAVDED